MQKCIDKNLVACQKSKPLGGGGGIVDFQPPALDVSTFLVVSLLWVCSTFQANPCDISLC